MPNADDVLIGTSEASAILGVSVATVTRWADAGKLPFLRKMRGRTGAFMFDANVVRRVAQERVLRKAG